MLFRGAPKPLIEITIVKKVETNTNESGWDKILPKSETFKTGLDNALQGLEYVRDEKVAQIPSQTYLRIYSQAANRQGGRLLIFRNFSDPPELIRTPHLLIFKN